MSTDLRQEMEAIRQASFGPRYERIRQALAKSGDEERKREFRELENAFFYLLTHIIANQNRDGWWNVDQLYQRVITAHAVRHLHKIGLSLRSRWNLDGQGSGEGNLFWASEQLIKSFHHPKPGKHARWGDDVWDDCYILLALLAVLPDFQCEEVRRWNPNIGSQFEGEYRESLEWLQKQFNKKGFNATVADAGWYGPGFYAAAIELFDHKFVKELLKSEGRTAEKHVNILAAAVKPMLEQSLGGGTAPRWENRFAWHAGQILVTWKEKRQDYSSLRKLDPVMTKLFKKLKKRQSDSGAWDNRGRIKNEEDQVYYTVRALAACYVNTSDDELLASGTIARTHTFLLDQSRKHPDGLILNLKASINALEAFQKLFDFRIRETFPGVLVTLAERLNKLGLLDQILNPLESEVGTLKRIRACARTGIEERGQSGLELLGVNDLLYQSLKRKDEFLKEFTGDREKPPSERDRKEIRTELRKFLSSTLTEARSGSSHRLIKQLWRTDGFLNFIPLIEHLSDLEQDRAFYKYYRDHLNHEVLLFLLGTYIYHNSATFREKVDDEILKIYEEKKISFDRLKLEGEFLFRWKLISTFHDIGYLFEVEPFRDKSVGRIRGKDQLLKKSFRVVDDFRKKFLFDYFMQYIETPRKRGQDENEYQTEREKEVSRLAKFVGKTLNDYKGKITQVKDLSKLTTGGKKYADAFKLISRYVKSGHIPNYLIGDYFRLCSSLAPRGVRDGVEVEKRPKFYDHGIMSALVLLKAADIQRHYLKELNDQNFSGSLLEQDEYTSLRNMLTGRQTRDHLNVEQFFVRFSHVAGAIALHNINPHLYMQSQCEAFDKRNKRLGSGLKKAFYSEPKNKVGRYIISLDENPLSYLTALADTLQDWDRHSFRRLSFGEDSGDPLSSSEVIIDFGDNDKINVRPLTRQAGEKYESMTEAEAMDQYLKDWRTYVIIHNAETH